MLLASRRRLRVRERASEMLRRPVQPHVRVPERHGVSPSKAPCRAFSVFVVEIAFDDRELHLSALTKTRLEEMALSVVFEREADGRLDRERV
jgi:hypothetical protein